MFVQRLSSIHEDAVAGPVRRAAGAATREGLLLTRSSGSPPRRDPAHRGRWPRRWWHGGIAIHPQIDPAARAEDPRAGKGDQRFLVADEQTQQMGHDTSPPAYCRE